MAAARDATIARVLQVSSPVAVVLEIESRLREAKEPR
jgi:hypothetical protein